MRDFLEKNKIPIAIIVAAALIAAATWLSVKPPSVPPVAVPPPKIINPPPLPPASIYINYTQAPQFIGQYVCVRGVVDNVETSRIDTIFLNFCVEPKKCPFGAVIFKADAPKFITPSLFIGKTVEITGTVVNERGLVKIILTDPAQIKIVQ